MSAMRLLIVTIAVLTTTAIAGCQTGRTSWYKKGASPAQVKADRRDCGQRAGGYDFLRPGRRSSLRAGSRSRSELYRWCMRDLGYRRID